MKDQETVQQFIELRSQGVSFARIAEQLGVAKSTLILWSREYQHVIHNLRAIEWEDFLDKTFASKHERFKALSDQLRRLEAELAQRDLASVPTPQLHAMAEKLQRRLARESVPPVFTAAIELSRHDESRPGIQDWQA